MRRFELSEGTSNKFWQIELTGTDFTVHWGRIGTQGQAQTKSFPSAAKAQAEHDKLIAEKTKKGYAEVAATGGAVPTPKPAAAPAAKPAQAPKAAVSGAAAPAPAASSPKAAPAAAAPSQAAPAAALPAPAPARPVVGGVAWSPGILRQVAPRLGSDLVEPRLSDADTQWAKLVKGYTQQLRVGLKGGINFANALKGPMTSLLSALELVKPPTGPDLSLETAAALFTLVGPKVTWQDDDRHGAVILLLNARMGPAFTFEALQLASTWGEEINGTGYAVVKLEHAKYDREQWFRRWLGLCWQELRAVAVAASAEQRAELMKKVEAWRPALNLKMRILFTMALERADWAQEDLAAAAQDDSVRYAAAPLVLLSESPEELKKAVDVLARSPWEIGRFLTELRYDLVARYGAAIAPYLLDFVKQNRSKEVAEALALIVSSEIAELFAKELTSKELRSIASEYLLEHADASVAAVASQATGNGAAADAARVILKGLVAKRGDIVTAREAELGPSARALVAELRADAAVKEEASANELPPVLRELPWMRKAKAAPAVVVELKPLTAPAKLSWTDAERQAVANAVSQWMQPVPDQRDQNLKLIASVNAGERTGESAYVFLRLPAEDAVAQFNAAKFEGFSFSYYNIAEVLIARHGLAVLPGLMTLAEHDISSALDGLLPVDAPEVAPHIAEAYARLKKRRAEALVWLVRSPETAARGLLAQALGAPGKKRSEAEEALRAVATAGHRARLEAVAQSVSAEAAAGLKSVLDYDALLALPKKLPAMPSFVAAAAFTRPLLNGRKKALSVASAEALCTMLAMSPLDVPYAGVPLIKAACDPRSLADLGWDLFQAWLFAGAPSKEAWAFTALGVLGNDETARKLTPLIRAWPGEAAHARAVTGLDVLARIGTDVALMHLHGIAQKLKFKGLQEKAKEKIEQVAEMRGFTAEELADRLVPDLGLDDDGTLWLDFGPRRFKVVFDELLKPGVMDDEMKRMSDLPKPRQSDDAEKSEAAVETWKALKKDAKTISQAQLTRLELAMCSQRRWEAPVFRQFLVEHPLLVHLVRRLVWGVYDDKNALTGTFRVAEDGSFASDKDDTFALGDDASVGIAHRLDLSDAQAGAWGQVFADYEVLQPFEQLARGIHKQTGGEAEAKALDRVKGIEVPTGKVLGLDARGWRRGPPQDGGVVCWYEKRTPAGVLSLDLEPGIYTGMVSESPKQKLGSLTLGNDGGTWGNNQLPFGRLSPVAYSEVVRDLESLKES
jgi:predicted DNA-binding WGR domain protein